MYWGVGDEMFRTNKLPDICFKEVNDCKSMSSGPYFLVIKDKNM